MNNKVLSVLVIVSIVIVLFALVLPLGISPNVNGTNYKNVTVQTRLNITNSRPEILNATFQEASNPAAKNITINAGGLKTVYCNLSVRDWNGFGDIVYLNGTIWHASNSTYIAADDNNTHYTNTSCTFNASTVLYYGWYVCAFDVYYYANSGTWVCNATVMDTMNATSSGWGNTTFYSVYALNVTDGIDYGNVATEDWSGNISANITNLGNMRINITVEGYGATRNDSLAMKCSSGNITVANEKFSANPSDDFVTKTALVGTAGGVMIPGLTMSKQNVSGLGGIITNSTYWQLYLDSTNNPGGNCSGYIIFTAVAS